LLAEQIRSGLVETSHDGAVVVVGEDGAVLGAFGDIDRPFYLRSAAKPFQALVSQEAGARLTPLELAVVSSSHRGFPVHLAIVSSILAGAGLDEEALRCPPAWPINDAAMRLVARGGAVAPRRLWHNCSGKHAGFLRACVASGWPTASYLEPDHPLQVRVRAVVAELSGHSPEPVGVDGCGAPVLRTTTLAMARLFGRLGAEERLSPVFTAMHRYPALIGANGQGDSAIATAAYAAAKGGAEGCIGIAFGSGLGVAAKCWDGSGEVAALAAVSALAQVGAIGGAVVTALEEVARPPVLGGGERVGIVEPRFRLERP